MLAGWDWATESHDVTVIDKTGRAAKRSGGSTNACSRLSPVVIGPRLRQALIYNEVPLLSAVARREVPGPSRSS